MVLLWGLSADAPFAAVRQALAALGAPVVVVDEVTAPDAALELTVGAGVQGTLTLGGASVDLGRITSAYLRPHDPRKLKGGRRAVELADALRSWAELTPARVVNRPSAMASNQSKPYQLALIRAAGFAVPATLITTDPDAVRAFCERHRRVVYKSVSGVRSIVTCLRAERLPDLRAVSNCPTQFQEHIEGVDHRAHVVGDDVLASVIESAADDYRYPITSADRPRLRPGTLPAEIAARCVRLAGGLGLSLAGIDLRRTPEGRWYCFEANPSPAFTFYEDATGQPLSHAVARLLWPGAG